MMSRLPRAVQLPLVGIIFLFFFVSIYLVARKRATKSDAAGKIMKHTVDTQPDDALEYWTAAKKRQAKGADLPTTDALDRNEKHASHPPQSSH